LAEAHKENTISEPVYVEKARVLAELRSRGLTARADWVDREMPDRIDAQKNSALLHMLGIAPDEVATQS
jgi:hypothetical protein